jgi:hypothetical protein
LKIALPNHYSKALVHLSDATPESSSDPKNSANNVFFKHFQNMLTLNSFPQDNPSPLALSIFSSIFQTYSKGLPRYFSKQHLDLYAMQRLISQVALGNCMQT